MNYKNPKIKKAFEWLSMQDGSNFLNEEEHCPTRDVFQARLGHMNQEIATIPFLKENSSLLGAIVGELGNNSFDHNLGNWQDELGVYFVYDLTERFIVIADRGQGVLATLRKIMPSLRSEEEAIYTAFTEIISGRAPEKRGNGLKFIENVSRKNHFTVKYYSGDGMYAINNGLQKGEGEKLHGVLALLYF